jgi:K+-sensing histidine kinase KdpD
VSSALDAVPGGVFSLSDDMRILAANAGMGELVDRPAAELVGESIDVVLSAPSRILFQTHVYPALKARGRVEEVFLTLAAGAAETTPVLFNAVRSPSAKVPTYDGLVVRIRARSQWESELLAATRAIEQERAASQHLADELAAAAEDLAVRHADEQRNREFRDAFIGVISHELRTPITTIYGMSHLLRERHRSMDVERIGQHLGDIEAESDRLRRLTEDLLVLSRAEGGRLEIGAEPIVVARIVERVVENERARLPGHDFALETHLELPLVMGEDVYVEQVVQNFLSNAGKYSPPGSTVRIQVMSEADGVAVRVIDAGPGFGGESPERLFDLFYRAPEAVATSAGAGIGLFVCRELIRAMGGRVWAVDGDPGAEFGFWLPAIDEAMATA